MTKIRNVVLLTVDALRADHVSYHGYPRTTTPAIDSFAEESVVFERAYSASSHTREALPSILTGELPEPFSNDGYHLQGPSIADRLSAASLDTAGFHSNPFASRAYGFDSGFDVFNDDLYIGQNRLLALGQRLLDKLRNRNYARAEEINERALDWLDGRDSEGGFFLWNHYMDVHGPYQPPSEYRSKFVNSTLSNRELQDLYNRAVDDPESVSSKEAELMRDLYDAEIRYCDAHIGNFLEALEERDLMSETLVVVTADHGDAFGEHGYFGHPRRLDDELLRVPCVVGGLSVGPEDIEVPVSTLDVMPTILHAVGHPVDTLSGVPLQRVVSEPSSFVDRVVFSQAQGEHDEASECRFAANATSGTALLTVDIDADTRSLESMGDQTVASRLEAYADDRLEGPTARSDKDTFEDPEIKDRLEALGYRE